jgi:hypothetical protein
VEGGETPKSSGAVDQHFFFRARCSLIDNTSSLSLRQPFPFSHRFTDDLRAKGIDVYWCENDVGEFHAMHNKNAVFGAREIKTVSGSCNWSGSAMGSDYHEVPINDVRPPPSPPPPFPDRR